jgi:alpha-mannosidase
LSVSSRLQIVLENLDLAEASGKRWLDRLRAEVDFGARLASIRTEKTEEWHALLERAVQHVVEGLEAKRCDVGALVSEAEAILAPLGEAAKEYTIYCCGHAHIDMNWMWTWPETVAVTYDTFSTMDKLMDEFPSFHFSQSQASVYHLTKHYAPELFERIKQRVAEGRWEITASQWVEGDKNMASGEILCRHLLYTRRWFEETMGIPYDQVKIDWECDTFGHCWTLPGILTRGGVTRYYHHRSSPERLRDVAAGQASQLYWWEGKDGSRLLAFDDCPNGYNCEIEPRMAHLLFEMERHTGLRLMLWVYGVGDHGGGPTRRHLRAADWMSAWPIWPKIVLGTTDDFFSAVEAQLGRPGVSVPVWKDELNFVFEGCYTSESRIKFANRKGENELVEAEAAALLARRVCGMAYPHEALRESWRRAMFLQFHDILPGSGVKETVEHAMGLFQETLAHTGSIKSRSLRAVADRVDTSALAPAPSPKATDMGLGGGAGNGAWWSGMSTLGAGAGGNDPFVVFNPAPFARDELVQLKLWDRDLRGSAVVRDSAGNVVPGQIIEAGHYWGHSFAVVAFPAKALPALGYRAYTVEAGAAPASGGAYTRETGRPVYGLGYVHAQLLNPVVMGNEHLELTICSQTGGVTSLVDKETGRELVPQGCVLGTLDREQEAPHGMTAWQLGTIVDRRNVLENCLLEVMQSGPNVAAVRLTGRHNDSEYRLVISLATGSRQVEFALDVNWLERGDPQTGVPTLRASFPLAVRNARANFEIACGSIERPANGEEAPALMWADLSGDDAGATLVNDSKYGHRISESAIRLTLLRSSYDPDPLPEIGRHQIRYALIPHDGPFDTGGAIRAGYAFNHPVIPVGTTAHAGTLPAEASALEILTPNVMLSGLKQAEDSEALIVRLYEFEGKTTEAKVRLSSVLADADSPAVETDLLERPLNGSTAKMEGDVLTVTVPAFGVATVKVG